MTLPEAIQKYRQRDPLPEEQVLQEQIAEYPKADAYSRNHLQEALVDLLAIDIGDAPPSMDRLLWQHQIALLDCLLSLSREVVEHRVLLADLKAQIAEAQKIAEVAA